MIRASLLCLVFAASNTFACVTDSNDHAGDEAHRLLMAGDYKQLDRLTDAYRRSKEKDESGFSKLGMFYKGFDRWYMSCKGIHMDRVMQPEVKKRLVAWRKAAPDSFAAQIAMAQYEIAAGWTARGVGWARDIPKANMDALAAHLATARRLLEALPKAGRNDPYWYALMLELARVQARPPEEVFALHAEGAALFPDSLAIHREAATYFKPHWHGSVESYEQFVKRAAQMAGKKAEYIYFMLQSGEQFHKGPADWPRAKRGMAEHVALYPVRYNRSLLANAACHAGDWLTLKEQMALMGGTGDRDAFKGPLLYEFCEARAKFEKVACFRRVDNDAPVCKEAK
jgi:hypothetical protein